MPLKFNNIDDFLTHVKEQEATIKRQQRTIEDLGSYTKELFEKYDALKMQPHVRYSQEEVNNFEFELLRVQQVYCGRIREQDTRISDLTHRLKVAEGVS